MTIWGYTPSIYGQRKLIKLITERGYFRGRSGRREFITPQYYRPSGVCRAKQGQSPRRDVGLLNLQNVGEYVDRFSSYILESFQQDTPTCEVDFT